MSKTYLQLNRIRRMNILLAEDDTTTNYMITKILSKKGWNMYSALNGKEAIDILLSQRIDLVITDIMMPLVNGLELLNFIKSTPRTKDIPVIGFSAGNKQKIFSELSEFQFNHFFEKPVDLKILTKKILELL